MKIQPLKVLWFPVGFSTYPQMQRFGEILGTSERDRCDEALRYIWKVWQFAAENHIDGHIPRGIAHEHLAHQCQRPNGVNVFDALFKSGLAKKTKIGCQLLFWERNLEDVKRRARDRQKKALRVKSLRHRQQVIQRDKGICRYCGIAPETIHIDHVVPIKAGGPNTPENLVVSCASCNLAKGAKEAQKWRE